MQLPLLRVFFFTSYFPNHRNADTDRMTGSTIHPLVRSVIAVSGESAVKEKKKLCELQSSGHMSPKRGTIAPCSESDPLMA
jgi:hypothetical protein